MVAKDTEQDVVLYDLRAYNNAPANPPQPNLQPPNSQSSRDDPTSSETTSHRQPRHLLLTPIQAHILRPQLLDLCVQMLPKHGPKPIQQALHLPQLQLPLPTPALGKPDLQLVQTLVDTLVVREEVQLFAESRHALRQQGENVLFFDGVVHGQVVAEVVGEGDELPDARAGRALVVRAGCVEGLPRAAEVLVLCWRLAGNGAG